MGIQSGLHGRKLDLMQFEYHFQSGNKEAILEEIKSHQNPDVGFQDMGECSCDESSPIEDKLAKSKLRAV